MQEQLDRIEAKLDQLIKLVEKKIKKRVDLDFRERMLDEFGIALGGQQEVDHQIDLALAHKTAEKYNDQQLYCLNWLKNAVVFAAKRPKAKVPVSNGDRSKFAGDYERRWNGQ